MWKLLLSTLSQDRDLCFLHIWTCLVHIPAATNSPISLLSSGLFPSVPFQWQTDLDSLSRRDNSNRWSSQGAGPTPEFAQNWAPLCVFNVFVVVVVAVFQF